MWLSTLPRRFGIILEKILDRYERSGIAVQWNRGVKVIPSRILLVRFRLSGDSVECNHGGFKHEDYNSLCASSFKTSFP